MIPYVVFWTDTPIGYLGIESDNLDYRFKLEGTYSRQFDNLDMVKTVLMELYAYVLVRREWDNFKRFESMSFDSAYGQIDYVIDLADTWFEIKTESRTWRSPCLDVTHGFTEENRAKWLYHLFETIEYVSLYHPEDT